MQAKIYIADQNDIFGLLSSVSSANIPSVRGKLSKGDRVSTYGRITNDYWVIDDTFIFQMLGDFNTDEFPLEAIYRVLRGDSKIRRQIFEAEGETVITEGDIPLDYRVLPFSKAVERGIGVCLERSILLQLSQQVLRPSFLVNGWCKIGDVQAYHAFNVVLKDGKLLLVDVKPRESSDGSYMPYVVPIRGINLPKGEVVLSPSLSDPQKHWK